MSIATVNHIYSGIFYLDKFAIGKGTKLVVKIPADLEYFKMTTMNNIVIMGRITWESMNKKKLPNRLNIVVTRHPYKYNVNPLYKGVMFLTPEKTQSFVKTLNHLKNVYVIGGSQVLKLFPNPKNIYITQIIPTDKLTYQNTDIFVEILNDSYKLVGYSSMYHYSDTDSDGGSGVYRHLIYKNIKLDSVDTLYKNLCADIINSGENRNDRTGVGTVSVFGRQMRIDLACGFPLLTTKYVPWRHVIEELLWFMRGDTDSKILERKGVKIWKGNTSRNFLDSKGLYSYDEGILGKGYGWQWRFFGAKYDPIFSDTSKYGTPKDGFDQLAYVIDEIKTNRLSRRILMCYWNPCDLDKVALPPCHFACQFYVRQDRYLDCMFSMRSTDVALGLPFNIASYATLTLIIAKKTQLLPGQLIYTGGDVHIYQTHVDSMQQLLTRENRPLPILELNDSISTKPIKDITVNDFTLIGYFPHPSIKLSMAI